MTVSVSGTMTERFNKYVTDPITCRTIAIVQKRNSYVYAFTKVIFHGHNDYVVASIAVVLLKRL